VNNQNIELAPVTIEEAQANRQNIGMRELLDSELLYVGGGTGNVIFNQPDPVPLP